MLALVQCNDKASYDKIINIFQVSDNPRLIIHGAKAIVYMKNAAHLPLILHKMTDPSLKPQARDELLYSMSQICQSGRMFYRLFPVYKEDKRLASKQIDMILGNIGRSNHKLERVLRQLKKILFANAPDKEEFAAVIRMSQSGHFTYLNDIMHYLERHQDILKMEHVRFTLLLIALREITNKLNILPGFGKRI
jgi:hypothetical protein